MRNILITGCSSGIGFETARILKENGIKVYASARKKEDVEMLKILGFDALLLDVTNAQNIKESLQYIISKDGKIDAVFNNAGFGQPGAVEDISVRVLKEQFETNFFGMHEVTIQILPIFRKQGYGKIIQHSSVLGIISLKFRGAYNASKYAIEGLADTLRLELLDTNITVSTINTGPVTSKFRENSLNNFRKNIDIENSFFSKIYKKEVKKRLESTDDGGLFNLPASSVANVVLKIMNSKRAKPRYYVTKATYILGFAKRVLSTSLLDKLLNKI
ncbi:SDR family NAD(P)-dependent oxidoreductase [Halarcobacter ebronensis]|uniref:Short-chain dehydrogenase n=1 Tax=Halarcobacter ebronensis TaxID=1462615 RepID=A0A4Q1ASS9_9BACT|nr:SDR family NAD(P)-dependent oxidoreductase [Halarcobacter ebronensis]QKF82416.1 short-chain dehydrogenase/reductase [Halarcobacter ebronensis]RXK07561.1 short-chain dehydrogenase [Halarcobacter ebronensis]